jgi:polar amino acid transport system permease protein
MALLIVASIWYLIVVSLLTVGQHFLERRLNRDRIGGDRSVRSAVNPDLTGIDSQL